MRAVIIDTVTPAEQITCSTGIPGGGFTLNGFDPIKDIPNGAYLTGFFSSYPTQRVMDEVFAFIRRRGITPPVWKAFDFDRVRDAFPARESGRVNGKTVACV